MIETRPWTGRLPSISMVAGSCALVPYTDTRPMAQQIRIRGIDIAQLVCHVVGLDGPGTMALRTRTTGRARAAPRARVLRPLGIWSVSTA